MNKNQVNRFYKYVDVYAYKLLKGSSPEAKQEVQENRLHSKVILVDGELSIVGSINLNRRSFHHELENTFVIWSPKVHDELESLLDGYKAMSKRIDRRQKLPLGIVCSFLFFPEYFNLEKFSGRSFWAMRPAQI